MLSVERIRESVKDVMDPELGHPLLELGMIKDISIKGEDTVELTLLLTISGCPMKNKMAAEIEAKVKSIPEVKRVIIKTVAMSDEEKNELKNKLGKLACASANTKDVGKIVAVVSGKGGVGKSAVSSLLAVALSRQKYNVGILDADITGPSIARMFGLAQRPAFVNEVMIPPTSKTGIKIMSMSMFLEREDDAVIWRGPMLSNAVKQLWNDVDWNGLDYLIIDMPPGTADVPLTVFQTLPVYGAILVSSPQELVNVVVRKALQLVKGLNKPLLGIVENMSYFTCPDNGKKYEIFGNSKAELLGKMVNAPVLGTMPIDQELSRLADNGKIEDYTSEAYEQFAKTFIAISGG